MEACGTFRGVCRRLRSVVWAPVSTVLALSLAAGAGADEFRCSLSETGGVAEGDARTALDLVCRDLRRASGGEGAYEVRLAALGRTVFVTAVRLDPPASITARLDSIEELPVAAPRLASALVRGGSFGDTQRVGNLLEDEARPVLSKKGSLKFLVGVADVESPGFGARAAGFAVGMVYATPRFALPAEIRFAWDDSTYPDPELSVFSLGLGGRAYLSTRDTSPFVGGGLGILRLSAREGEYPGYDTPTTYFEAERFGVAPYVEAGVEVLRLHRARLALQVRADFPLGSLAMDEFPVYVYDEKGSPRSEPIVHPAQSRYVVPVTIGVTVAF